MGIELSMTGSTAILLHYIHLLGNADADSQPPSEDIFCDLNPNDLDIVVSHGNCDILHLIAKQFACDYERLEFAGYTFTQINIYTYVAKNEETNDTFHIDLVARQSKMTYDPVCLRFHDAAGTFEILTCRPQHILYALQCCGDGDAKYIRRIAQLGHLITMYGATKHEHAVSKGHKVIIFPEI